MNDHPRIDPAAVVGGDRSTRPLPSAADVIVDCPTCGKPAATNTLRTISIDAGSWFGFKEPNRLTLNSQHCVRDGCQKICESLLQRAERHVRLIVQSTPKLLEA